MIVTRGEILDAADRLASGECLLLDVAFCGDLGRRFDALDFLEATGHGYGGQRFELASSVIGREQRLTFLAFMLAWHDDITGAAK